MLNRLEMMRIFCAAAEANSFKDAANRLGISPQAVTRAVKELENTVGESLFYRNTRQMRITDFGEQLASRARDAIGGIDKLFNHSDKQLGDKQQAIEISGMVRITGPSFIGRHFMVPILSRIASEYPNITLDLRLADTLTDAIEQQIDIGVRVGFLRDSSFIARAATKVAFYVVASPDLIARVGKPEKIQDLHSLPTIALVDQSSGRNWPWYFTDGQQFNPHHTVFVTDDSETELRLALNGIGFGQIADCLVRPYLESGKLVQVLAEHTSTPWDLYVYRPQRGPVPARIRIVYDRILEAFSHPDVFRPLG